MTPKEFTIEEMVAELKREVGMRYGVYTKAVQNGRMTEADKTRKIQIIEAIIKLLLYIDG